MAKTLSSDSDSDLEVLQLLSDWESDDDFVPCRFSRTDFDLVQRSFSQQDDELVQPGNISGIQKKRRRRIRVDHMDVLNDSEFTYRFRLNKSSVQALLIEIMPYVQVTSRRNNGVAPLHQLLLTLRFYALGTMLVSIADFVGVSKSSASRIVQGISAAIARLYNKYVVMHKKSDVKFYKIAKFPRVFGAIDCCHVRIQSPKYSMSEKLKNREGFFSLNVQAVCDADLRFINVVARWPGSVDEDTIFDNSILRAKCESGAFSNQWLLGDSAYANRSYLLTPVTSPLTANEQIYNEAHSRTWNTIQQTFGEWKRRFPVIALTLRLKLHNIENVIIATAVLYNICKNNNIEEIPPEVEIPQTDITQDMFMGPQNMEVQDLRQRTELIENYFKVKKNLNIVCM